MANWHIMEGLGDANAYSVLYHISIPTGNNRAGVPVRNALIWSGVGGTTVMAEGVDQGHITTAEKAAITAGALYEYAEIINTNPGETLAAFQARIDARYQELIPIVRANLSNRLSYWGYEH